MMFFYQSSIVIRSFSNRRFIGIVDKKPDIIGSALTRAMNAATLPAELRPMVVKLLKMPDEISGTAVDLHGNAAAVFSPRHSR